MLFVKSNHTIPFKTKLALIIGKITKIMGKVLGKKGTTLPGVIALKVDKNIVRELSKGIQHVIFVTGTNGKTTTSNLIASMLRAAGKKVIHNTDGANMMTGVAACLIDYTRQLTIEDYDYAVIEVDEASLPKVIQQIKPNSLVITNFFRDQLDRFGEIDILIQHIKNAITDPSILLYLNTDDPFVARFNELINKKVFFGIEKNAYSFEDFSIVESKYCPSCGEKLDYEHVHFSQVGYYHCSCGFKREKPHYQINKILNGEKLMLSIGNKIFLTSINGAYNAYNILAAFSIVKEEGIDDKAVSSALQNYSLHNGRMQLFKKDQYIHLLNLVKNPAGANHTIAEIIKQNIKQIVFYLNDFAADGRDISWIYDVDFEKLKNIETAICSGKRAYDAALRLKYAGISESKIIILPDFREAVKRSLQIPFSTCHLATYTNLEPVLRTLSKEIS